MTKRINEPEIVLTYADKASPLWTKLRHHLDARLESAQRRLEQSLDDQNTNIVRGEIFALRSLIRLEEDPIVLKADNELSDLV